MSADPEITTNTIGSAGELEFTPGSVVGTSGNVTITTGTSATPGPNGTIELTHDVRVMLGETKHAFSVDRTIRLIDGSGAINANRLYSEAVQWLDDLAQMDIQQFIVVHTASIYSIDYPWTFVDTARIPVAGLPPGTALLVWDAPLLLGTNKDVRHVRVNMQRGGPTVFATGRVTTNFLPGLGENIIEAVNMLFEDLSHSDKLRMLAKPLIRPTDLPDDLQVALDVILMKL